MNGVSEFEGEEKEGRGGVGFVRSGGESEGFGG